MVVKAGPQLRGGRTHGLLAYLLGPGRHTDHVDPRIVAGWVSVDFLPGSDVDASGRVTCRETTRSDGTIRRHPKVAGLAAALELPVRAVSETMRPAKHVWHCVVQNDPRVDPVLSDEVWAGIAAELVDAVGLAGCRWVAVRHDDHGIHIAATLVTETGERPRLSFEIRRLNACRTRLETQHCRRRTDPGTRTGGVSYQRHEVEKARREGATRPAKIRIRNAIEKAVLATADPDAFQRILAADGVQVAYRYSTTSPDQITGYKVALDTHTTAGGDPVWYKASDIDRALTWPKIQARWGCPRVDDPHRLEAVVVNDYTARARVAADRLTHHPYHAARIRAGVADLTNALAHTRPALADGVDWDQLLDNASWSCRSPGGTGTRDHHPHTNGLTAAARCLLNMPTTTRPSSAAWALIATQTAETLRALTSAHALAQRHRQAEQAHTAAHQLTTAARAFRTGQPTPHRTVRSELIDRYDLASAHDRQDMMTEPAVETPHTLAQRAGSHHHQVAR